MASLRKEFEHLEIQLEEIKAATNNFKEENVIGHGGFGKVYKGKLSHSHSNEKSMVALKRLDRRHGQGDTEFHKEVRMLSCYRHENIISLLGFSSGRDEMVLVYEYASRGSLDGHLKDNTLTWTRRIKICLDAAKGLSYLHNPRDTYQRLIHCDIKSANILLDDNFKAKVSDFGLSKIGPVNQQNSILVTGASGTPGYIDPVYMEGYTLTKESDVYSFGVVLFEVLCGKLCIEYSNGQLKVIHVPMWKQSYVENKLDEIILQDLMQQMDPSSMKIFSDIAFQCLRNAREERPTMSRVVEELEIALESQEFPDLRLEMLSKYEDILKAVDPLLIYKTGNQLKELLSNGLIIEGKKAELQVFEQYQHIVVAASQYLFYRSFDELKHILSKGVHLNGYETWFSLNDKGEHCHMISMEDCLTLNDDFPSRYKSHYLSRFPAGLYQTYNKGFKTHVKTQLLSPSITYTVNLVFYCASSKQVYVDLKYRLRGETTTSTVYLANQRRYDDLYMAELYQFTCDGRIVDFEIIFENSGTNIAGVEGIMFRPVEKVEDQLLEDDKVEDIETISDSDMYWEQKIPNGYEEILELSKDSLEWKTKKELYSILCEGFLLDKGQQWFSVDKNGKKCQMLSARAATFIIDDNNTNWESSNESRFGEVLVITAGHKFEIKGEIKSEVVLPETNYASYLVYKLPQDKSTFEAPMFVSKKHVLRKNYIYLVSPPVTPVIGSKLDENSYNPLNRYKGNSIPQQRTDGWMEVKVWEFQTTTKIVPMNLCFEKPDEKNLKGLMVQGIELRPI
nr:protein kinase-like domain, phloem protein 2-like protein [Tanacetum cinerariifolium]